MKIITAILLLWILLPSVAGAQDGAPRGKLLDASSSTWVQTGGPGGGRISDIAFDSADPSVLYAGGSLEGIYVSTDSGDNWELMPFPSHIRGVHTVIADPRASSTIYCAFHGGLLKSSDRGETWHETLDVFGEDPYAVFVVARDPLDSDVMYAGGEVFSPEGGGGVYRTGDGGLNWEEISVGLDLPAGTRTEAIAAAGNGTVLVGINDRQLTTWHKGKVFVTKDDGQSWSEMDYGQREDRFIWSLLANPHDLQEVWLSEGSLYNYELPQPLLYRSTDVGESWKPVAIDVPFDASQVRVIESYEGGRVYVSGGGHLFYTDNGGESFVSINPPSGEMTFGDLTHIAVHPDDADALYLPLHGEGIAHSRDGGRRWELRNSGIIGTSLTLLAADPADPSVIYAASSAGNGTYRSDDFGENWIRLNAGGIVHPWADELLVDPVDPDNVWFVSDVPYIHRSRDRGTTWEVLYNPYLKGGLNFCSVYAMDQPSDPNIMYVLSNGFGIFKGARVEDNWNWEFLKLSEVDYTYSLAVDPENADVLYSGYSRKPFETAAKVTASYDGGENWFLSLNIEGAEAVTSVVVDPQNSDVVYAASTGEEGGALWVSRDKGGNWQRLNEQFNFTTIHSFAVPAGDSPIAYAGVWGGGTYRTADYGANWTKLDGKETFSVAAIALDPADPDIVYVADRTEPILYRSADGGESWDLHFDAGPEYRRLMSVTLDPTDVDRLYVAAMKAGGPGMLGGMFEIDGGAVTDIGGDLPKVALSLTVDPATPATLYTVLHESGVYRSTNYGRTWTEISGEGSELPESGFSALYVDPTDSHRLYLIGGCDVRFSTFESAGLDPDLVNGVYRSADGGETWENIGRGSLGARSGPIKSLVFYDGASDVICLGAENGVYYTTDGGSNWQSSPGLPYGTLGGIAVSGTTIHAFTNGAGSITGTIESDYSITWNSARGVVAGISFAQLLQDPADSATLYASGYPGGIFKSTDGGLSWHEKNFGMVSFKVEDPLRQGYYALDISESNPEVLYLGLYEKGVYRSFNGAETWYPVNGRNGTMTGRPITSVVVDPTDENTVYAAAEDGVYRTTNGGQDWEQMNSGLVTDDVKLLHLNADGELYAGSRGYGLYLWRGGSWEPQNPTGSWGRIWPMWNDRPLYQYTSLLIHPEDNSRMLLGTFPQGIYKSADGGASFRESNIGWTLDGVFRLVCHPENPEIVYAGTYNGLNRSLDFGDHWEMWDNGWPPEQWVFSIAFDPTDPDVMYACSKNGENEGQGVEEFRGTVMKSLDGGASWFEITDGLDKNQEFYKILVDRFDPSTLYLAAQYDGMFISRDAGDSWTAWNEGLTNHTPGTNGNNVTNVLVFSTDHSVLYFGSDGSGVFRRMIAPILAVRDLGAQVRDHQVLLTWRFTDLNDNFGQYNVYRSTEPFTSIEGLSLHETIVDVADTTLTDSQVEPGVQYYYAVTTVDVNGYENGHIIPLGPVVDLPTPDVAGDFDGSGKVDFADFFLFADAFGGADPAYDLDSSGKVDFADFFLFADSFGKEGREKLMDLAREYIGLPTAVHLEQNYPNPFNSGTVIGFVLPGDMEVELAVYSLTGQRVVTLVDDVLATGVHAVRWDGRDSSGRPLASGVYLYQLRGTDGQPVETRKLVLVQ